MSYRYLVNHYLEDSADATPDKMAVVDGDRTVTYAELEARSNQVANLLIELGVRRGHDQCGNGFCVHGCASRWSRSSASTGR